MKIEWKALLSNKRLRVLAVAALALAVLILYFLPTNTSKTKEPVIKTTERTAAEELEEVLSQIRGAGRTRVMITYESDGQEIVVDTIETETSTVRETTDNGSSRYSETVVENKAPVTVRAGDSENALVVSRTVASVKGVIVVSEGARDLSVRMQLQKAVETVLQVSSSRVEIFAMK